MSDAAPQPIRLATLVMLRWAAVAGQFGALAVAWGIGLRFPLGPALVVVAMAAAINIGLTFRLRLPLSQRQVAAQLYFDLLQLTLLLTFTGGLDNPFTALMLAPVTIAATALPGRQTVVLGLATIALITLTGLVAEPLRHADGTLLIREPLLLFGHWVTIVIGVAFFATYASRVSAELSARSQALFATQLALAREQRLQHLGGVVAAAAHELGTPLATIKLVSTELLEDLRDELAGRPDLLEDLALLGQSADRCRDILRSMGRQGREDLLVRDAPLEFLLAEAVSPHDSLGKRIVVTAESLDDSPQPTLQRDPAAMHGLRNLIQNAVDFAASEVRVAATWSAEEITITISDDGKGYPPQLIERIGEPFLGARRTEERLQGYEGMGLGLFISVTLLGRSGARLEFGNGGPGAVVRVSWPRAAVEVDPRRPLGPNPPIPDSD